jgi:predicted MFS family arabinose efflux permease
LLTLVSTGIVFVLIAHETFQFFYLITSFFIVIALTTILETIIFSYVGQIVSEFMMGKIMAIMVSFIVLGYAIGDFLYGFLLRRFIEHSSPGYALIILASIGVGVTLFTKIKK